MEASPSGSRVSLGDEWLHTSKGTATFPHSPAAILSIVYHKKNTPFNRSSRSRASNDWNSLMLHYEQIIVLQRWEGNIIKQESKTKRRKQPVSKVIQAGSLLSWPYECGTKGLWSDSNAIHGCHGSFYWDYWDHFYSWYPLNCPWKNHPIRRGCWPVGCE